MKRKEQITGHSISFGYYSTKASQATEREIPVQIKEIQIFLSYKEAFTRDPGLVSKDMTAVLHQKDFIMLILTSIEGNSNKSCQR